MVKAEQVYALQAMEQKRIQQKIIAKQQKAESVAEEEKLFATYIRPEEMPKTLAEKRALLKHILAAKKRSAKKKAAKKRKLEVTKVTNSAIEEAVNQS